MNRIFQDNGDEQDEQEGRAILDLRLKKWFENKCIIIKNYQLQAVNGKSGVFLEKKSFFAYITYNELSASIIPSV